MSEPQINITDLVDRYIQLRDKKAEIMNAAKAKCARIDDALDKAEAALLAFFQTNGMDSASCGAGTAYTATRTSATVQDWDQTLEFIKGEEAWHLLEKRVSKKQVEEYVEANGDLPPGIKWSSEIIVNVRRS